MSAYVTAISLILSLYVLIGEKAYNDSNINNTFLFNNNPYRLRVVSPYGFNNPTWLGFQKPKPGWHARSIHQTINLNNKLNSEAQAAIDAQEPKVNIWDDRALDTRMSQLNIAITSGKLHKTNTKQTSDNKTNIRGLEDKGLDNKHLIQHQGANEESPTNNLATRAVQKPGKPSRVSSFRQSLGIKSSEERAVGKMEKAVDQGRAQRNLILAEEEGRWPNHEWREIISNYQQKVGMTAKIADLRTRHPIQYLHLLRAGYFEPIPVAWATQTSNPLKFSIEAAAGWRGLTPAWRGYEDTAEERLYWVLNHREGSVGMRMKPDFISEMNMARARMATAVEPPPAYYSANDTCHLQHTSTGYSKQVMPPPFVAYDRPEVATDDTMILLDVSGSMDFDPLRPIYDQYLVTGFAKSTQPKNKGC